MSTNEDSRQMQAGAGELPPIAVRGMRMKKAIALQTPDRVPFVPTMSNFYALSYDVSLYDAMKDIRFMKGVMDQYLDRFEPDLCNLPLFFPIDPMSFAGYQNVKWPGPDHGLPVNTPYQYVDNVFMTEDEYDIYLKDPSAFLMQRVLAKKYSAFAGLAQLQIPLTIDQAILSMASFGVPEVKEALLNMIHTGELVQDFLRGFTEIAIQIVQKGFIPFGASTYCMPFDYFADNVRGLINTCCDLLEDPEKVDEAVNRLGDILTPAAIAAAKTAHTDYVYIPLHCGHEKFMSLANYEEHYWPSLKKMMEELIAAGLTPLVFCEGKYDNRLDVISDIPKGKAIYIFEEVDLETACKKLEGIACVASGMRTQTLMSGNRDAVIEETKKSLEIGKRYGNLIMSNTLCLDKIDLDIMQAWQDTTFEYGVY